MKLQRVFVDANVIIDIFGNRPNSSYSVAVLNKLVSLGTELFTSCDLITTVYYVLSKADKERALAFIEDSAQVFTLIPFSNEEVIEAVTLMRKDKGFKDLEDTIQYVLAKKKDCDWILTNDKGFFSPDIKVLSAQEACKKLGILR